MVAKRLLVIDDDANIAQIICRAAAEMGFDARHVNGDITQTVCKEFQPDIITLDILMPEMDGFEVIKFIEANDIKSRVIILSGSPESYRKIADTLGKAVNISIEANLRKPFRLQELREVLERISASIDAEKATKLKKA